MAFFTKPVFEVFGQSDQKRIFEEMTKILLAPHPDRWLGLLVDSGFMQEAFPELQAVVDFKTQIKSKALWPHTVKVVKQAPAKPVLRWAALFHDVGKPVTVREFRQEVTFHGHEVVGAEIWEGVADRLKVSEAFKQDVSMIIRESGSLVELKRPGVTDKALRRFVRKVGPHLENIYQFTMADMTSKWSYKLEKMKADTKAVKARIDKIIEEDSVVELKLPKGTGTLLIDSLGLKGKALGDMMEVLTDKLISGELGLDSNFVQEAAKIVAERDKNA
jgi:poly(A) polymerase